jgi:hypothetical protein
MTTVVIALLAFGILVTQGISRESPTDDSSVSQASRSTSQDSKSKEPSQDEAKIRGLPLGARSAKERFDFLKRCSSYQRFKMLFESQRDNPEYALNNASVFAAMSQIEQEMFMERVRLVESGDAECERWMREVSAQESLWQVYEATLKAAQEGDGEAAVCFVMSPWDPPEVFTRDLQVPPERATLRDAYAAFAGDLIDREIKKGSWPMVVHAYNAATAEHGVKTAFEHTQAQAYVWARLMQLGTSDPERKESYGYRAAEYGAGLGAAELAQASSQAEQLFRDSFGSQRMTDKELYENCGH